MIIYDCVPLSEVLSFASEHLLLISAEGDEPVVIDSQLQSCGGLRAYGLDVLFWSPGGRYLYTTNAREGVPDGCGHYQQPVIRTDTTHWQAEYLGGGPRSPDGARLAVWKSRTLSVWDLDEGEIGRVPAADADLEIGPIAWAPYGQSLVYVQVDSYCPLRGPSAVIRVDLPTLATGLLTRAESAGYGAVAWETPGKIRLLDESGQWWVFDLAKGELELVR